MTAQHPLERFTDRAQDYAKYRPGYPPSALLKILAFAQESLGQGMAPSSPPLQVADIGAGTGISSQLLAAQGAEVTAVEPNQAMVEAAADSPAVTWQIGQAEATGLTSQSVDVVTCFQSFHWFRPEQALPEFHRILRPGGSLALVWHDRDTTQSFTQALETLVQRVTGNSYLNSENRRSVATVEASPQFGPVQHSVYDYRQVFDFDGLVGRCRSSSYIPKQGRTYDDLMAGLRQIFQQWQSPHGTVEILYKTHLYLIRCKP